MYYATEEIIFSIGAHPDVQSQLLEAILEHLIREFSDMYDDSLLNTCYGDSCTMFNGFSLVIQETLSNINNLGLTESALVSCKGCGKTLSVIIRKSLIENSTKTATPLVYVHKGHALLIYIDKQYKVRGSELVSVSY